MASYTNVPDSVLEPGDPIRSVDIIAIKDNIEHYAENNGTTNVFTSPGTWSKPATVQRIKVTVVGGGGAGGPSTNANAAGGGGGGGGGASIRWIPAPSIPGPVSVTTGAAGGTSSFGAFASATGGATGANGVNNGFANGGAGGVGSGGDLNITGTVGGDSGGKLISGPVGTLSFSGAGGNSILGGGAGSRTGINTGINGGNYGGGGSGGVTNSFPAFNNRGGGAGAAGVVIVEEFY
jgi:hypothetical protein